MAQCAHGGGFSVDASVRIEANDRAARERLLRYCARPPFALDRLDELDCEQLISDRPNRSPAAVARRYFPLQLLDSLAALEPSRPSRPRLRRAGANGRSREISATTTTV
ncbi:MAG: transposase [Casimicrobiaceae bacterium]